MRQLLAGVPEAVAAAEPGAGGADKSVLPRIFLAADRAAGVFGTAEWRGGDGSRGSDRATDHAGRGVDRRERAGVIAVVAVLPVAVAPIGAVVIRGCGGALCHRLASGIRIGIRAARGGADGLLRHCRAGQRRSEQGCCAEHLELCHAKSPLVVVRS